MKRVHIVGGKNSGKTTIVEQVVQHLSAQGMRVGTIKHTHHRHELDTKGKDSHRHREAGAAVVGILSPDLTAIFRPTTTGADPETRYADIGALFAGCELVVVEGNLQTTAPKVEVWRAAATDSPIAASDPSIAAVVTDDPLEIDRPVWPRADVEVIAQRLLKLAAS